MRLKHKTNNVFAEVFTILKGLYFHFKGFIFIAIALLLMFYINYSQKNSATARNIIETSVRPLYQFANESSDFFNNIKADLASYWSAKTRMQKLESENKRLQKLEAEIENLKFENTHLKAALNYVNDYNPKIKLAKVIRKGAFEDGGFLIINAGKTSDVKVGDIITNDGYLIGIVQEVYHSSAKVITIFNKDFSAPVYTSDSNKSLIIRCNLT